MAHEIEINADGKASFFGVQEPAWHGLGTILDAPPSINEAIILAGLDWGVQLKPLYMKCDGVEVPVPSAFATIRDTDQAVLGVVGPTYHPLQNAAAFEFFQPWIDEKLATLECAGSLRGGKRVWVLAKLTSDNMEVVPGDEVAKYVLLSNGHDGTLAVRTGFTGVRVVCANTLATAHGDGGSKLLRVRHTKKTKAALEEIRETMNLAEQGYEATVAQYRSLARKGVKTEDLRNYVRAVFKPTVVNPSPLEVKEEDDCDRLMGKIIPLFEGGRGNNLPGVAGTLWGAYNSLNEYLNYERGSSADGRISSLWFGDSARLNQRALKVALQMVG